jgi:hypothetical protein
MRGLERRGVVSRTRCVTLRFAHATVDRLFLELLHQLALRRARRTSSCAYSAPASSSRCGRFAAPGPSTSSERLRSVMAVDGKTRRRVVT